MIVSVKMQMNCLDTNAELFTTNVPYIRSTLTDVNVKEFAKQLNSLTNNTLVSVYKVTAEDVTQSEDDSNG